MFLDIISWILTVHQNKFDSSFLIDSHSNRVKQPHELIVNGTIHI